MDFQWEKGNGPVDENSPFISAMRNNTAAKKRTHSIFDSPSKPLPPTLRPPTAGQTHLFSQQPLHISALSSSSKPLPARPDESSFAKNPALWTPRNSKLDLDFCSSGGETPETPGNAADSEATPDTGKGRRPGLFGAFGGGGAGSPAKERRRDSFLQRIMGSPGRGDAGRETLYSRKGEKIIKKRRAKAVVGKQVVPRRGSSDSDDEEKESNNHNNNDARAPANDSKDPSQTAQPAPPPGPGGLHTFFTFLESHPGLPHILSFYAQLLLNLFLVFFFIFLLWSFWSSIRADVNEKAEWAAMEARAEIAACAKGFRDNMCEGNKLPAMEAVCASWEKCMRKDPTAVGRARVSAHTFAEIFNSFVEPISYKAMIFTLVLVFGCVSLTNFTFSFFRNKALNSWEAHHPHLYGQPQPSFYPGGVPPTPQRFPSGGYDAQGGYGAWQGQQGQMEQGGGGSPVKQIMY
ncbi:hypothetical protein W97_03889 [Coniosporium apollinis CBS 100218]|uniref:Brl1/Brr6 domain-containing protein n=1 Tax=Coniosporium apollinis (strain CBS 100218) TaxID=1168221 RepID=R7YSP4_CONA1|nr:uncharacterized protein W97_03889 [Coniosporium apollinis CBS 100218]EON64656.1 hypothetical protein W97_03889 [Coniosporium apollinis CBS 100218]